MAVTSAGCFSTGRRERFQRARYQNQEWDADYFITRSRLFGVCKVRANRFDEWVADYFITRSRLFGVCKLVLLFLST